MNDLSRDIAYVNEGASRYGLHAFEDDRSRGTSLSDRPSSMAMPDGPGSSPSVEPASGLDASHSIPIAEIKRVAAIISAARGFVELANEFWPNYPPALGEALDALTAAVLTPNDDEIAEAAAEAEERQQREDTWIQQNIDGAYDEGFRDGFRDGQRNGYDE